ncbi:MAG: methyltransferase type 11 [Lachnospiraceae bacterium]|nr:methyltransferase type 11 [Lachnospiraceae bacterium]
MANPWEKIELSDYENHMSLESVYQLQVLNKMMGEQFEAYDIDTIMILGIAGGNGLEHIDKSKIKKVYGVDVNQDFLAECKKRYGALGDVLETIGADLLDNNLQLPHSGLLVANLLVEYIGYECFQRVVGLVKPFYVSCIIQINTGESFVSDSPYVHAFDCLEEVHHQMDEKNLTDCMSQIGYELKQTTEQILPNGKKLVRLDFGDKKNNK